MDPQKGLIRNNDRQRRIGSGDDLAFKVVRGDQAAENKKNSERYQPNGQSVHDKARPITRRYGPDSFR